MQGQCREVALAARPKRKATWFQPVGDEANQAHFLFPVDQAPRCLRLQVDLPIRRDNCGAWSSRALMQKASPPKFAADLEAMRLLPFVQYVRHLASGVRSAPCTRGSPPASGIRAASSLRLRTSSKPVGGTPKSGRASAAPRRHQSVLLEAAPAGAVRARSWLGSSFSILSGSSWWVQRRVVFAVCSVGCSSGVSSPYCRRCRCRSHACLVQK